MGGASGNHLLLRFRQPPRDRRRNQGVREARGGVTVNTVYNGCGILTGQMRTISQKEGGAGFPDVYMACDRYYLENVKDWFQEDVDVSDADIVIVVPKGNPKKIKGIGDLTKPGMRVSVGQPEQCTIGALTRTMLQKMNVYDEVMKNVVMQTASSSMLVSECDDRFGRCHNCLYYGHACRK